MLLLALSQTALAGYVVSVGDEIEMEPWGTFHRTAPNGDDGWLYMIGTGGNWGVDETDNDHVRGAGEIETVVPDFDQMVDRAIARCPDKGWLLAASGSVDQANDTLWTWRFDEDWQLLTAETLVDAEKGVATNDMALVCSTFYTGVGVAEMGGQGGPVTRMYELDGSGNFVGTKSIQNLPSVQGAAFIADEDSKRILMSGVDLFGGEGLRFVWLDENLDIDEEHEATVVGTPNNARVYWPQGLMAVGDLFLVVHMARDESAGWASDEGNVYLQIYDQDFNSLEGRQISQYEGPEGSMRPGVSRRGETLAISWDAQNKPIVVDVELDLSGAHVPGDSGDPVEMPDDTGPGSDGDDTGDGEVPIDGPCGCAAGGGLAGAWVLGLVALWSRRRR